MASASAPASELAVQLPAPASSIAEAPPPASTAEEAVDPSAGAVILEDPGPALLVLLVLVRRVQASFLTVVVLLIFIYRRLCSGFNTHTRMLEVVALHLVSFSSCVCHMHRFFIFSSLPSDYWSSDLHAFLLFGHISQVFRVYVLVGTWVQILPCIHEAMFLLYHSLHMSVWSLWFCETGGM